MPKISIIIPVYNVEDYLPKCIDSILNQSFNDFELILVNDGSTDNSGKICDMYASKDKRIIVIHKKNGGQGEARNYGIDVATGDYIGFVDSDDVINSEMYNILYNLCVEKNAEVSVCKMLTIRDDKLPNNNESKCIKSYTNKEAIKYTYDGKLAGYSACNKLYNRKLFNNIRFPVGKIYEDASTLYKLYMNANKIIFIDRALYYYIRRENSTTNRPFNYKRMDIVDMFNEKYEYMSEYYPEMKDKIKSMYYDSLRNIVVDIVNEGSIVKNYFYIMQVSKLVRNELRFIFNNNLILKKHKVLAMLIAYTPIIPIILYRIKS